MLKSGAAVGEKANACRELKLAGTEKSIPVLASLLTDAELSHPARFALESMPYPAAGAALREALGKATGLARSGIIDSLGQRRDPLAVPLIAPDLATKDLVLVAAAATALGKIGTSEAAALLTAARANAQGTARIKIDDGLLLCADRLRAAGKDDEAAKIYAALVATGRAAAGPRRRPARPSCKWPARRRPASSPKSLADDDAMVRAAAAAELHTLSDADLGAIAGRHGEAAPDVPGRRARRHSHPRPQCAGARGPGGGQEPPRIGPPGGRAGAGHRGRRDGPARAWSSWPPRKARSARRPGRAWRPSTDPRSTSRFSLPCGRRRTRSAGPRGSACSQSRRPAGVVPLLLDEAAEQDPVVATRALAALAKLAAPKDIPALVAIVLKTEKGPVREEAERAVRQVCLQIADATKRAQPVLEHFPGRRPGRPPGLVAAVGPHRRRRSPAARARGAGQQGPGDLRGGRAGDLELARRRRPPTNCSAWPRRPSSRRIANGPCRPSCGSSRCPAAQPAPRNWRSSSRPCSCRRPTRSGFG